MVLKIPNDVIMMVMTALAIPSHDAPAIPYADAPVISDAGFPVVSDDDSPATLGNAVRGVDGMLMAVLVYKG